MHGLPDLRAAIAEHQERFYGLSVDPATDVVVTTGASEAIQSTLLALCDMGDEVVVFEPWFDIYAVGIALANATRVSVPLRPPTFRPDIDALRAAFTDRTRLLLLNSPHNPTGVVFTPEELQAIADLAIERDLIVLRGGRAGKNAVRVIFRIRIAKREFADSYALRRLIARQPH